MAKTRRPPIPIVTQVAVLFRDSWLCHLCRRPIVLHLALKHLDAFAREQGVTSPLAYWDPNWRRDKSPLLDELAASIDHVEAYSRGGAHGLENFAAVCARCNARKSAKAKDAYLLENPPWEVKGLHGEPTHWDGLSSLYVVLARTKRDRLTPAEREWLKAIEMVLENPGRAV
ncbi:MAG: HNH endonuclease signature motif containing protein [Gemmatimonadales bacterium]